MNDSEARLTAALRADMAPARDAMFRVDVLRRLERTRFRRRVVVTMAVGVALAVLVAVNAQAIGTWMAMDGWSVWIVALAGAVAIFALPGVPLEAAPGARVLIRAIGRWLYS